MPGYNTLNEVAAFEALADLLEPDAVVFCPTNNDVDSSHRVLPNGSLSRALTVADGFGLSLPVAFQSAFLNSHLYLERWRMGMAEVARLSRSCRDREVPFFVFFTGRWFESFVHELRPPSPSEQ